MSDFDGKIEFEKFPPAYRLMIKYTELENRIDKAIEIIEDNQSYYYDRLLEYEHIKNNYKKDIKKLLDILKGEEDE